MKLIIDIPEEDFEWINTHLYTTDFQTTKRLYESVRNGTPLDSVIEDIKAELTKDYVDDNPDNFRYTTVMLKDVLAIIDKYKAESEEE